MNRGGGGGGHFRFIHKKKKTRLDEIAKVSVDLIWICVHNIGAG